VIGGNCRSSNGMRAKPNINH